jgi:hypothetical protein
MRRYETQELGTRVEPDRGIWCFPLTVAAQQSAAPQAASTSAAIAASSVPQLLNYSGVLTDINGKPLTNVTGVTLLLYKDQQGGAPLWMETQNVHPDRAGHYSVTLGSTTSQGVSQDVFVNGEARWLAVQIVGQEEQPRVLLVAVPYALKAAMLRPSAGCQHRLLCWPMERKEAPRPQAAPLLAQLRRATPHQRIPP